MCIFDYFCKILWLFKFDTSSCGLTLLSSVTSFNPFVLFLIEDFLVCSYYLFVCHCSDLALRNCFLTSDLNVKVGDYGIGFSRYKVS